MARLEMSIEHGEPPETAQGKFEWGVSETVERYGSWIRQVTWSEDRRSAMISGSGYEVRLWFDERFLHARGHIPLAWKLFEPAIRHHVRKMLDRAD